MVTPEYYIENGLRFVKPYYHLHNTTVKRRWLKRTVVEVLSDEFRTFDKSEYIKRIEDGMIWVERRIKRKELITIQDVSNKMINNKFPPMLPSEGYRQVLGEELLKLELIDGDRLFRWDHKHERPIKAASLITANGVDMIHIIKETNDVVIVSKPPLIPIHPVQKYYYNSLVEILKFEAIKLNKRDWNTIRPCHRLDKLTSGICIFAKNTESASKIQSDIQNGAVAKTYLAKVGGQFPKDLTRCQDPVLTIDAKKGQGGIRLKDAVTEFELVWYDEKSNESVIKCQPKTGRTHQIRIHLRNLGYPIKGDPIYSEDGSRSDPSLELNTIKQFNREEDAKVKCDEQLVAILKGKQEDKMTSLKNGKHCEQCQTPLFYDPNLEEEKEMCLHAIKYEHLNGDWEYQDQMPHWAIHEDH